MYLCIITYNGAFTRALRTSVVNCFKMCIFALSRTTVSTHCVTYTLLWIASKCVSLHYHVQLSGSCVSTFACCELLQNVYLCIITYNRRVGKIQPYVLWIASKCVSLHYHVQRYYLSHQMQHRCELLQNVYLCIITYNLGAKPPIPPFVVNCFKMCIFALSRTTLF